MEKIYGWLDQRLRAAANLLRTEDSKNATGGSEKPDDDTRTSSGCGNAFTKLTGLFRFVLGFVLVSLSEPRTFEAQGENAKNRIIAFKSNGFIRMASDDERWVKMAKNGFLSSVGLDGFGQSDGRRQRDG